MSVIPLKLDATANLPRHLQTGDVIDPAYMSPVISADVVSATTYTLAAADAGREKQFPNGCTVTLDASVLTASSMGLLRQTGTSGVTVTAAAGTTIYPSSARATAAQGSLMSWRCDSSTLAYVNGETA